MQNDTTIERFVSKSHAKLVLEKIKDFLATEKLTDVVLVASDDSRIPAHRLVLSSGSEYFRAMFTNNLMEAHMPEVKIQEMDPRALKNLVDFCYTGEIDLDERNIETLLSSANLLQMIEVVDACSKYLISRLDMNNAIGFCLFAESQGCRELHEASYKFIMDNFHDVFRTVDFINLPAKEIKKIFSDETLNVEAEYELFQALEMWMTLDFSKRINEMPDLLSEIRLAQIPKHVLLEHIESKKHFRNNLRSYYYIVEALKYHLYPELRYMLQSPRTRPRKSTVGKLLCIGGMNGGKAGSALIDMYDFRENTWTAKYNTMPSKRLQFGAAILNNILYIVGGRDGLKTLNIVESYDFASEKWIAVPSMTTHRHGLGVIVLGGQLYAVGGHDGWSYLTTVERFDPSSQKWSFVHPMNHPRSTAGVAVLNGRLFVVGGRDGSHCLNTSECFDPYRNKWSYCAPMSVKRGGVSVGVVNGYLYALGGHDSPMVTPGGSRFKSVERYDPRTDTWTKVASMSMGKDAIGVTSLGDLLFAVGGYDGQSFLNLVEVYDPVKNKWEKLKEMDERRAGTCIVVKENHFQYPHTKGLDTQFAPSLNK